MEPLSRHLRRPVDGSGRPAQETPPSTTVVVDDLVDTANHLRYVARLIDNPRLSRRLHDAAQSVELIAKTLR